MDSNPQSSTRAYVTFLAGDSGYIHGVVGLAKGLRKVSSAYPLVVAVHPTVPHEHRDLLWSQGCVVRDIEPLCPPQSHTKFSEPHFVTNYCKLRVWEFVEYEKLVFMDGDTQVYENIDNLFNLPNGHIYAVMDCFCERTWKHTIQNKIGYCQHCPEKKKWPAELGPPPSLYFNTGVFVFEPDLSTYHDLLETLKVTPPGPFAEQDFMNVYFRDVYKPIPNVYNLVLAMLGRHPDKVDLEKTKVIHYCGGSKPWAFTGKEENMDREDIKMLVQKWWEIYGDEKLDYKNMSSKIIDAEGKPMA
ncbi:hypothetical protein Scep_008807 [Stephania cephalantha]|uniref:Hexosyltransferase n=1 Tax=Stephania cephalantha TaxID=152367 RepID=A0AAP0JSG4_9MAGN